MAAPRVIVRGLSAYKCTVRAQFTPNTCVLGCCLTQTRFKGTRRVKAPHVAQEKEKWIPRALRGETVVKRVERESWLARTPDDNVWFRYYYPKPKISFEKALQNHSELCCPEMLDNMEGFVTVEAELDLRTKKKTKFMQAVTKTIVFPHDFDDGSTNRVIAFCKTPEDKEKALELGAVFAGGLELIKEIEKGEITVNDFDYVVCTVDVLQDILGLRKILKDQFPHKSKDNLSADMETMMLHFTKGKTYQSEKVEEAVGNVKVQIGKLNMPVEELINNYNFLIEQLSEHRHESLGPFVSKAHVTCPPSPERFLLVSEECIPLAKRKSKPVVAQEVESNEKMAVNQMS